MRKKCTPLWREAHFEVNMFKKQHVRTTFGNWDVESARRCGAKHNSKSKGETHHMLGPLLDVEMSFRVASARDCAPCQKWAKREGFVACPKTMAGVGRLKRICKDAFSVAGAAQETRPPELLGGRVNFLRGVALWSIRSSVLGRWFCVTGAALRMTRYHFFVAGAVVWAGGDEKSQNALVRGRQLCGRIASFLMLSTSKHEEVSQNCFVFDVVKFKKWGSLAELFRFWRCQVQKLRKSRKIAAFSSLQIDRKIDRKIDK